MTLCQGSVVLQSFNKTTNVVSRIRKFKDVQFGFSNPTCFRIIMKGRAASVAVQPSNVKVFHRFVSEGKATFRYQQLGIALLVETKDTGKLASMINDITGMKLKVALSSAPCRSSALSVVGRYRPDTSRPEMTHSLKRKRPLHDSPADQGAVKLSASQTQVLQYARQGRNLFFTGSAGTGKSTLLRELIRMLPKSNTAVTASTAAAASILGGTTLHAFAGIYRDTDTVADAVAIIQRRKDVLRRWLHTTTLVIDEISMVDADLFDLLEGTARHIRRSDKPFGGLQVVVCGDFFQLPPVTRKGMTTAFCFQSRSWPSVITHSVQLTKVFRQSDSVFVDILNDIRWGRCTEDAVQVLRRRWAAVVEASHGIVPTKLYTHRSAVERINSEHLQALPGAAQVTTASDTFMHPSATPAMLEGNCPAPSKIELKVGAQVMLIRTLGAAEGLVNGARGVVTGFVGPRKQPQVRFTNGREILISQETWTVNFNGATYAERSQLPLKLAWAISIHKSQGMTLDAVEMSLARVFEYGQAYVALSRSKSLEGLRLMEEFDPSVVKAHPKVVEFYTTMQRKQSTTQRTQPLLPAGRPIAADENNAPDTTIDKTVKILKLASKPTEGAAVLRQTQPRAAASQSQAML